jgi:hypothetical protein
MNLKAILKTPRIEFIYVMWTPKFMRLAKIGRTRDIIQRRNDVAASIKGVTGKDLKLYPVFAFPVLLTDRVEAALHEFAGGWYGRSKELRDTNGGSEWFRVMNVFSALLVFLVTGSGGLSLAVLMLPFPVDFFIYAALLSAAQVLAAWAFWAFVLMLT